ncbi:MAG: PHP domain-containing protein [Microgenomates group bacterium]
MSHREYQPIIYNTHNTHNTHNTQKREFYADLHTHTKHSDGMLSTEEMVDLAILMGLSALSITDHDTLLGSDNAADYVSKNGLPIELIRGMEISSQDGHILAYNIDDQIPPNLTLSECIRRIHRQNGIVIIPHPEAKRINGVPLWKIQTIIDSEDPELYLDGIEIYNASENQVSRLDGTGWVFKSISPAIINFIQKNKDNGKLGALMANSDTHTRSVGYGKTGYQHHSIIAAIAKKETIPYKKVTSSIEDLSQTSLMFYAILMSHIFGSMSIFKR